MTYCDTAFFAGVTSVKQIAIGCLKITKKLYQSEKIELSVSALNWSGKIGY